MMDESTETVNTTTVDKWTIENISDGDLVEILESVDSVNSVSGEMVKMADSVNNGGKSVEIVDNDVVEFLRYFVNKVVESETECTQNGYVTPTEDNATSHTVNKDTLDNVRTKLFAPDEMEESGTSEASEGGIPMIRTGTGWSIIVGTERIQDWLESFDNYFTGCGYKVERVPIGHGTKLSIILPKKKFTLSMFRTGRIMVQTSIAEEFKEHVQKMEKPTNDQRGIVITNEKDGQKVEQTIMRVVCTPKPPKVRVMPQTKVSVHVPKNAELPPREQEVYNLSLIHI